MPARTTPTAAQAQQLGVRIGHASTLGSHIIKDLKHIEDTLGSAKAALVALEAAFQRISQVSDIITQIAGKAKLLAIEAARGPVAQGLQWVKKSTIRWVMSMPA